VISEHVGSIKAKQASQGRDRILRGARSPKALNGKIGCLLGLLEEFVTDNQLRRKISSKIEV
jgi:hypothetical protein